MYMLSSESIATPEEFVSPESDFDGATSPPMVSALDSAASCCDWSPVAFADDPHHANTVVAKMNPATETTNCFARIVSNLLNHQTYPQAMTITRYDLYCASDTGVTANEDAENAD